ncbi:MarR family winged helix-turn-helix transcriptional regulator [Paenibacillus contaminans]|uniref:MarR family transcriptional regulator n=1 Tax=Paenibacillus contaminans TaxID=450362 RepID=A0A329MTN4_9BACL|nr:MarR family winged helix-turn-helix transcriptional regulator [Paenibacillus contaminans]RAV23325.1 MarR family transcriptional regulator [Paenibacillus contaminans]
MKSIREYVSKHPLEVQTFFAMVDATSRLIGHSEKYWSSKGLNGARIRLLVEIAKEGGSILPSVLADRIGVTRANISVLLVPLEEQGYIQITGHPEDGRKRSIALTPEGENLLWAELPGNREVIAKNMSMLDETEMRHLLSLMSKLSGEAE